MCFCNKKRGRLSQPRGHPTPSSACRRPCSWPHSCPLRLHRRHPSPLPLPLPRRAFSAAIQQQNNNNSGAVLNGCVLLFSPPPRGNLTAIAAASFCDADVADQEAVAMPMWLIGAAIAAFRHPCASPHLVASHARQMFLLPRSLSYSISVSSTQISVSVIKLDRNEHLES